MAMAVMLLVSTTSWKVEKHYCMGHLVDMAFFVSAEDCGMAMSMSEDTRSSCCDDEVIVVDGQDNLKLTFNDLEVDQQSFLIAFTSSYIDLFTGIDQNTIPFKDYSTTILIRDVQILDQTFLI